MCIDNNDYKVIYALLNKIYVYIIELLSLFQVALRNTLTMAI